MAITREPRDRKTTDIRPLSFEIDVNRYAEGSVLVKMGYTHVLCTASIEESVPDWMQGKGKGWVTGEYSMLPRATHTRSKRDRNKVSGRTQEIQRLVGRSLRACVNMKKLGERSIVVDCDVLQADGGTRTASINGGCVALALAIQKLESAGKCSQGAFCQTVSAISIGFKDGQALADLDYREDSSCDVDMNFVMTGAGAFVEIQGTAEKGTFTSEEMGTMTQLALASAQEISKKQRSLLN